MRIPGGGRPGAVNTICPCYCHSSPGWRHVRPATEGLKRRHVFSQIWKGEAHDQGPGRSGVRSESTLACRVLAGREGKRARQRRRGKPAFSVSCLHGPTGPSEAPPPDTVTLGLRVSAGIREGTPTFSPDHCREAFSSQGQTLRLAQGIRGRREDTQGTGSQRQPAECGGWGRPGL